MNSNNFFIDFSDTPFLETSQTGVSLNRLNNRAMLLLTQNKHLIEGKRILDIASHDGRWSYACLKLGAKSVYGVEGREELVRASQENLKEFDPSSFNFICSDIFDVLHKFETGEFDVILCFGFLYHTIKTVEFFSEIQRLRPSAIILDTAVCPTPPLFDLVKKLSDSKLFNYLAGLENDKNDRMYRQIKRRVDAVLNGQYTLFLREGSEGQQNTVDTCGIVSVETEKTLKMLFKSHGFQWKKINWHTAGIKSFSSLQDYRRNLRASYVLSPEEVAIIS